MRDCKCLDGVPLATKGDGHGGHGFEADVDNGGDTGGKILRRVERVTLRMDSHLQDDP